MTAPQRGEVWLVDLGLAAKVFDAQNLVTIPHGKLIRSLGRLSAAQLAVVERAMAIWLGLSLATGGQT